MGSPWPVGLLSSAFVSLNLHLGFGLIFRHFEFGLTFKLELFILDLTFALGLNFLAF